MYGISIDRYKIVTSYILVQTILAMIYLCFGVHVDISLLT